MLAKRLTNKRKKKQHRKDKNKTTMEFSLDMRINKRSPRVSISRMPLMICGETYPFTSIILPLRFYSNFLFVSINAFITECWFKSDEA